MPTDTALVAPSTAVPASPAPSTVTAPPASLRSKRLPALLLVGVSVLLGLLGYRHLAPAPIALKSFEPQVAVGVVVSLLGWLFAIALFVERSVEVIVSVLRDADADQIQSAADTAPAGTPQAADAQTRLLRYRAATKELALCLGFGLGILVSLAGVRALSSLVVSPGDHWLYTAVDILVTGSVIAGGSEGIHQMANVITNFLQALAAKAKGNAPTT